MRSALGCLLLAGCDLVFRLNDVPETAGCPEQFAGDRYLLVDDVTTWGQAQSSCLALDDDPADDRFTHLAVLTDDSEAVAVPGAGEDAWVGLFQRQLVWAWVTSEFPDDENAPWNTGFPVDNAELCAAIEFVPRALENAGCAATKRYICECDGFASDVTQ